MLIAGDISGIQGFLFDVAQEGGGQARRLRARSFYIQLLSECIALRVLRAAGWGQPQVVFSGAGKFILHGDVLSDAQLERVNFEREFVTRWLAEKLGAQLSFSLALASDDPSPQQSYERLMASLQREKARSWSAVAQKDSGWLSQALVLNPLDTPCALCGKHKAERTETDDDGTQRRICELCHQHRETGKRLPRVQWIAINGDATLDSVDVAGLTVSLLEQFPREPKGLLMSIGTASAPSSVDLGKLFERRLARHVPTSDSGQPLEFKYLAEQARGDKLLAILKADADSLGEKLSGVLQDATGLTALAEFSAELESFFGETIDTELKKERWRLIYTVFAGGDDLMLVGPWEVIVDFAGHLHGLFAEQFGERGMTISAGVSFLKYKRPIKHAAEHAEDLLNQAKTMRAPSSSSPKDQCAAFGQVWKWKDHDAIVLRAKRLAARVDDGSMKRGSLHTLLELGLMRQQMKDGQGERATSRLAYHVARNYPKSGELRRWVDQLLADFDDCKTTDALYLRAITRYALTATRNQREEDQ
jgi:CRISPR-associated protein Csm1